MSEQNVGAFFGVAEGDSAADAAVSNLGIRGSLLVCVV
jgi:hypothetical protein